MARGSRHPGGTAEMLVPVLISRQVEGSEREYVASTDEPCGATLLRDGCEPAKLARVHSSM